MDHIFEPSSSFPMSFADITAAANAGHFQILCHNCEGHKTQGTLKLGYPTTGEPLNIALTPGTAVPTVAPHDQLSAEDQLLVPGLVRNSRSASGFEYVMPTLYSRARTQTGDWHWIVRGADGKVYRSSDYDTPLAAAINLARWKLQRPAAEKLASARSRSASQKN
jgi:hypothetical protein